MKRNLASGRNSESPFLTARLISRAASNRTAIAFGVFKSSFNACWKDSRWVANGLDVSGVMPFRSGTDNRILWTSDRRLNPEAEDARDSSLNSETLL